MPDLDDPFIVPRELAETLRRLAYSGGVTVSDILGAAVRDYMGRQDDSTGAGILSAADARIRQSAAFVVTRDAPRYMLIVKSPLEYVHRPAIKYQIEIDLTDPYYLGWLNVILRRRDLRTEQCFSGFLQIWTALEARHISERRRLQPPRYNADTTSFRRGLYRPPGEEPFNSEKAGFAIGEYLSVFDAMLKLYMNTSCDGARIEREYLMYLKNGNMLV